MRRVAIRELTSKMWPKILGYIIAIWAMTTGILLGISTVVGIIHIVLYYVIADNDWVMVLIGGVLLGAALAVLAQRWSSGDALER